MGSSVLIFQMRELSLREQKAPGGGHTARAETCTWWALIATLFCLPLEVTVRGSCNDLENPTGQSSSPPPATSGVTLQESHNLSEHPFYLQIGVISLPPCLGEFMIRGEAPSTVPRAQWHAKRCSGYHFYRGKSVPRSEPHPAPPLRRARADHS